jgi:hypothetical protein
MGKNPESTHFVTVGMSPQLVRNLWNRIAESGGFTFSHIAHPSFDQTTWDCSSRSPVVFFRENGAPETLPPVDHELLASLEADDVPSIHNMILSDRFISKLRYQDALSYATFLVQRLIVLYRQLRPSAIVGGFDSLHGSLGYAVAKREGILWTALYFNPLPSGLFAVCSSLSPASMLIFEPARAETMLGLAAHVLGEFESRKIHAAAYIPPRLFSPAFIVKQIPIQLKTLSWVIRRRKRKNFLQFTDASNTYSVTEMVREALRLRSNLWRLPTNRLINRPIGERFAFFGLHMQPESSIDVWAHFFSNQVRVIEYISRSLPPTHSLLVKLHKSDVPNYSRSFIAQLERLPSVHVVSPYADTYAFINNADIIFAIQGTIGLEGALLGKPVIMFGDSPVKVFPSASTVGNIVDLPKLVREKLQEPKPERQRIIEAYARYLAPMYPGSSNDWLLRPSDAEIEGYVHLFHLFDRMVGEDL